MLIENDATVFFRIGTLRYDNSDYTGAVSAFEKAVILDNNYLNARYLLGQSYQKIGRKNDALMQYQILNKISPSDVNVKKAIDSLSNISAPDTGTDETSKENTVDDKNSKNTKTDLKNKKQ